VTTFYPKIMSSPKEIYDFSLQNGCKVGGRKIFLRSPFDLKLIRNDF
jgi:hypothetical protein